MAASAEELASPLPSNAADLLAASHGDGAANGAGDAMEPGLDGHVAADVDAGGWT